jgi:hypothetical protein
MLGREISYVMRYAEHLMSLKAGGHIFSEDEKSSFVEFLRDNTPEKATV